MCRLRGCRVSTPTGYRDVSRAGVPRIYADSYRGVPRVYAGGM